MVDIVAADRMIDRLIRGTSPTAQVTWMRSHASPYLAEQAAARFDAQKDPSGSAWAQLSEA
ncbi:MAG: hypothetical protein L0H31_14620, partial [Nocardioidaceae bacterium]|nr:hypothetical protein [Nocardioidaceae bacterium]